MVAGGERGSIRRPRPQGTLRLKPPDLNMRQKLSKEAALAVAKDELFIEKL